MAKVDLKYQLTEEEIIQLILHVGDHAGAQGHVRNLPDHEEAGSCLYCAELMNKLFPKHGWEDE